LIFVGDDWSENHHDIEIQRQDGKRLAVKRLPEGLEGVRCFHELIADQATDPGEVVIGIETDRGLWVAALVAAGYQVYAVNPKAVSRYRERHSTSGAKSDAGDAKVLADMVRTDRHNHRQVAGDSELGEAIKVLARSHQRLIWTRQRQVNSLRSVLREFYPAALVAFGTELAHHDAVAVLRRAPTPALGRKLSQSQIAAVLRRGGRQRYAQHRAGEIQSALRTEHLQPPTVLADAFGASVSASVAVINELNTQIGALEATLGRSFEQHPDAEIICSLPGLGTVVGARVLGEFGDDPERYADARARKNYAATSPITVASGKRKAVKARFVSNRHLADACYWWAFSALSTSPGARGYYDAHKARHDDHDMALRALANRLVGVLHHCLATRQLYDEDKAWPVRALKAA
jgi:transposase